MNYNTTNSKPNWWWIGHVFYLLFVGGVLQFFAWVSFGIFTQEFWGRWDDWRHTFSCCFLFLFIGLIIRFCHRTGNRLITAMLGEF